MRTVLEEALIQARLLTTPAEFETGGTVNEEKIPEDVHPGLDWCRIEEERIGVLVNILAERWARYMDERAAAAISGEHEAYKHLSFTAYTDDSLCMQDAALELVKELMELKLTHRAYEELAPYGIKFPDIRLCVTTGTINYVAHRWYHLKKDPELPSIIDDILEERTVNRVAMTTFSPFLLHHILVEHRLTMLSQEITGLIISGNISEDLVRELQEQFRRPPTKIELKKFACFRMLELLEQHHQLSLRRNFP